MAGEGSQPERRFCEVCGAEVRPEANFCPSCGAPRKPGLQVPRDPTVPPPGEGRVETERMNMTLSTPIIKLIDSSGREFSADTDTFGVIPPERPKSECRSGD